MQLAARWNPSALWIVTMALATADSVAQDPTCRERSDISVGTGASVLRFFFNGIGTHGYGSPESGRRAGEFNDGVYTCWHPGGRRIELAYDGGGVRILVFDADGKEQLRLRSDQLNASWHPNGRIAFLANGGRVAFWNDDGTPAADVRLCQDVWSAWGTDMHVDEWDVWSELLHDQVAAKLLPTIIEGIRHQDPWVRVHACKAAVSFTADASAAAVPLLRRALQNDESWLVRERAAAALARLGPLAHEAVPELAEVLRRRDEAEATRQHAAFALGWIGARAAVAIPALEEASRLGLPALQITAIAALARIDPGDRASARQLVAFFADEACAPLAADALSMNPRLARQVRDDLQHALAARGEDMTPSSMSLSFALHRADPGASQPKWFEPNIVGPPPLLPRRVDPHALLTYCMLDDDPEEIEYPLQTLLGCDNAYLKDNCMGVASDSGPDTRAAAPGLMYLLNAMSSETNEWAGRALVRIGVAAVPLLASKLAEKEYSPARSAAARILGDIGEPAAAALATAIEHPEPYMRVNATSELGRIGPAARAALPALRNALASSDPELRQAAAEAIAKIEGLGKLAPRQR